MMFGKRSVQQLLLLQMRSCRTQHWIQRVAVLHISSGHREVTQKQPLIFRGRAACVTEEDLGCSLGGA